MNVDDALILHPLSVWMFKNTAAALLSLLCALESNFNVLLFSRIMIL
jgi:hypothetical protein